MRRKQAGFIKLIILVVIILIVLGYFGFNIQNIFNAPAISGNLHYVWGLFVDLWNTVLVKPALFVWNKIIIGFFWNAIIGFIAKIQATSSVPTQ